MTVEGHLLTSTSVLQLEFVTFEIHENLIFQIANFLTKAAVGTLVVIFVHGWFLFLWQWWCFVFVVLGCSFFWGGEQPFLGGGRGTTFPLIPITVSIYSRFDKFSHVNMFLSLAYFRRILGRQRGGLQLKEEIRNKG